MKKSFFMLFALMQVAFADQLIDGKYVNFENYVDRVVDVYNTNPKTLAQYKSTYVNGNNSTRHYVTNDMLQNAFNAAKAQKAVGVYLPPGVWNFNGQVVVPYGMTLKGSYDRPHHVTSADLNIVNGNVVWNSTKGTNIACFNGWNWAPFEPNANDLNRRDVDACIALQGSATLDGVNVYYPQQNAPAKNQNFNPVKYPWTISCQKSPEDWSYFGRCAIMNTTLVNSYAGIDLTEANDHFVKGVNMTTFKKGIRLDQITSLGTIEDINIHTQFAALYYCPYAYASAWPTDTPALTQQKADEHAAFENMERYILANNIGLEFGWVDWGGLKNVFVYKANKGFYFRRGISGHGSSGFFRAAPSIDIQNSGCDQCVDAVYVDEVNSGIGVNFSNSNLIGRIYTSDNNYGPVRITNSYLEYNAAIMGKLSGTNYYYSDHVVVGDKTTMQITNSELVDFMGDLSGLWVGYTFRIRGNLFADNVSVVWPNKGQGFHASAKQFYAYKGSRVSINNILFRGKDGDMAGDGAGDALLGNYLNDPLNSGYHPVVR